jgi:aminoglycoside phosphotransferase (APT) family kinase protein
MQRLDLQALSDPLLRWLAQKMPYARGLAISSLTTAKGAGFSAETIFVELGYSMNGAPRTDSLVLRREYEGTDLFLDADPGMQCNVLQAMAAHPQIPVPAVIGMETDPAVLGAPFFVMRKIAGRTVPQTPNYNTQGWVAELSPVERSKVWRNAIEMIARIHRVDWHEGFEFLDRPQWGAPGMDQYLGYVEEWYSWAARGRSQPVADAALDFLRRNKPLDILVSVLWGDATPANLLIAPDNNICGVIDWEIATLGPAEADLAWWIFFDDFYSEGVGVPRLDGLPDRAQTIAIYEAAAGRTVQNLDYFEIMTMLRLAIVTVRQLDRQVSFGRVRADSAAHLNNPITAMLARKLGLPVPQVGVDFMELSKASSRHQA